MSKGFPFVTPGSVCDNYRKFHRVELQSKCNICEHGVPIILYTVTCRQFRLSVIFGQQHRIGDIMEVLCINYFDLMLP